MFEPLSALAVLGFAMGTIGFVVTTISKTEENSQEMRECESRLCSFNWDLGDVVFALKAWHWLWIGEKAFPLETYDHFWGHGGVQDIQARVDGITELANDIRSLLRQPLAKETEHSLPSSELKVWHQLIDNNVNQPSSQPDVSHKKIGLVRKIGFTLFLNTTLSEKTARLKRHVEGLKNVSQQRLRLEQGGNPSSEVNRTELYRISELKAFVDRVSCIGSSLFSRSQISGLEWAIELGPPLPGYELNLWSEMDTIYIDFIVRDNSPDLQPKDIRVGISVEELCTEVTTLLPLIAKRVEDVVLSQGPRKGAFEHDRFFRLLGRPGRRSRPFRKLLAKGIYSGEHRKIYEMDSADLAYGLGHWMVLLWNTPWLQRLCTCGIRCTLLSDAHTRHSFIACRECYYSHPPSHVDNRFQLLGVVLAEIALGLPISVLFGSEGTSYVVGEETAGPKQLLNILRRRFGSTTITKAVGYCLEFDPIVFGESLRPDHLEQYIQEIVLPLKKYYETVSKHCQSTNGRRLRDDEHLTRWYDSDSDQDVTGDGYNEDEEDDIWEDNEDNQNYETRRGEGFGPQ